MFQDEFVVKFQVDLTLVLGVYDQFAQVNATLHCIYRHISAFYGSRRRKTFFIAFDIPFESNA